MNLGRYDNLVDHTFNVMYMLCVIVKMLECSLL